MRWIASERIEQGDSMIKLREEFSLDLNPTRHRFFAIDRGAVVHVGAAKNHPGLAHSSLSVCVADRNYNEGDSIVSCFIYDAEPGQ